MRDQEILTDDQEIHLLELPNFRHGLDDLRTPLDLWLYFLKNGDRLDADALPTPLTAPTVCQAMEVLKMFSQDEMERELYEGRLKARRDAQTQQEEMEKNATELKKNATELGKTKNELGKAKNELGKTKNELGKAANELKVEQLQRASAEQGRAAAEARSRVAARERDAARAAGRNVLVEQIRLCRRILGQETISLSRASGVSIRSGKAITGTDTFVGGSEVTDVRPFADNDLLDAQRVFRLSDATFTMADNLPPEK